MNRLFYTLVFLFVNTFLIGQETIILKNPSFEDIPRTGKAPDGWYDCGFPGESPPDVQPSENSDPFFGVTQQATDGNTYISMVARDNDTWEMVGQKLDSPLKAEMNYHLTVDLCRSAVYTSMSRVTNQVANYTSPLKLRIWGGNGYCAKKELLAETPLVINTRWLKYDLRLAPSENFQYLVFECFYKTPFTFPYNGNLLMDNLSAIKEISLATADSIAVTKPYNMAESAEYEIKSNDLNESEYSDNSAINAPLDSLGNIIREWSTAGVFTDTLRHFLREMKLVDDNSEFSEETTLQLKRLVKDLKPNDDYNIVAFGILGSKKRRKELSQPIYDFMVSNNLTTEQIKIVKVAIGEMDENWVGKNQFYYIRLE